MTPRLRPWNALLLRPASLLAAATLLVSPRSAQEDPEPAPYDVLDRVGGSWVNLATFPVRPMVYGANGKLWVVNHHDSTVERFTGLTTTPDRVYGVPWSPVSIAYWEGDGEERGPELLVVCRGTWAVVGLDPATGRPTRLLQLRPGGSLPLGLDSRIGRMAEPGDILVDEANDRAFVSCTGADSVVQIDLVANEVVRVFNEEADPDFRLKSPLFLSWDHDGESVLVAPLHSGNNSFALGNPFLSTEVTDFAGATQGLPDEDLFRIVPWVDAMNPGTVEVVLQATGTVLFAHGIHPGTSDFWQLNTEANNKNPSLQTEPAVSGIFADNRVSIVQNSGSTWGSAVGPVLSLDPGGLSGSITTSNTVGQPVGLAFRPDDYVYVSGLLTDNVVVLDQNGAYVTEINLPDGAIPRALLQHPTVEDAVLVYCWGDNKVRGYVVDPSVPSVNLRVTYDLRHDPTPADVAAGREVFFDAIHSAERNLSCATCHVEGGNDFLVWNLSNGPLEQKGPMFTQTLVGLKRLAPFHWRGERQMIDFQPAFVGLLGATPDDGDMTSEPGEEPTDEDFARFADFVFSLVNPANPNQNRERLLDPDVHHPGTTFTTEDPPVHDWTTVGNAVDGQSDYADPALVNVARHACIDCHDFPTGSNNEINVEAESANLPRRIHMKPAPFHELWRKRQSLVHVIENGNDHFPPFLGTGLGHMGNETDLFRFVSLTIDSGEDQKAADTADLLFQWDQGLGLAAHFAFLLDEDSDSGEVDSELETYLTEQEGDDHCSIAVIGMYEESPDVFVPLRWAFLRGASGYVCEDPTVANRSLADFVTGAAGGESHLFVGLPPGMAERFAIDYDMDGVRNLDSTEVGYEYDDTQPGWDNGFSPAFASGGSPDVIWESTKVARVLFTTNEPTRATIDYGEPKTDAHQTSSPMLSRFHSVLLTGMRPSTDAIDATGVGSYAAEDVVYDVTITLEDATGNVVPTTPFEVQTDDFIVPMEVESLGAGSEDGTEKKNQRAHVVQAICMGGGACDELTNVSGDWRVDLELTIAFKRGEWEIPTGGSDYERVRAEDRAVFGRVLVERASGEVETAEAAGLAVTPVASSCWVVEEVWIDGPVDDDYDGAFQPSGAFLAGRLLTDADGLVGLAFDVDPVSANGSADDLATGDRIVFVVEGVLEVNSGAGTPIALSSPGGVSRATYAVFWRGAFNQWSFPDTKEKNASVRSEPLP